MRRRDFLVGASAAAVGGGLASVGPAAAAGAEPPTPGNAPGAPDTRPPAPGCLTGAAGQPFPLVRARPDRIVAITVCTRPFRAQGPRIETERLGRKILVHNYGHGGAGWSLSWGSATLALRELKVARERDIAVIGCGVIGLTSALMAQRAGFKVKIYAKERPPEVRSTFATGNWSPESRIFTSEGGTPEVVSRWEEMARISYRRYQLMLGLPGDPVEWRDGYYLSDPSRGFNLQAREGEPQYPPLQARIEDILPRSETLLPGTHPFPTEVARRFPIMVFNIAALSQLYVSEFLAAGGVIETREFESPRDIARLREKVVINATGYGARALFGDESVTPVRGQITRLIPQPEVNYALQYSDQFYLLARRDALILQTTEPGDFGNEDTTPNREVAERTVRALAALNERIRAHQACTPLTPP
jgi:glycine/D-amino acid oxidase-like deaminating enzyme